MGKVKLGNVLIVMITLLMFFIVGEQVSLAADLPYDLVSVELEGDSYLVEKTVQFDLQKPLGVAVVLGGGGARALVNVGVLKALEEEQIPIDFVIGTSMGAIVAVLYGSGMSVDQIEQLVTEVNLPSMFYVNFPFNKSLINTTEINHFIEKVIPFHELENFPIPTALLSYDLNRGVRYIATTGKVGEAVGGPYAIPLCFPGERIGESFLIDAGVWELTPSEAARVLGAKVVIATTALDALPYTNYDSPLRSWARMINLIKEENAVKIVEDYSDVVIDHEVGDYSFMDFHLAQSFIDLGYQEAKKQIPEIKRLLNEQNIALRSPAKKYAISMENVLTDVKYDRQVMDPFVAKPVFYYGKDHSLMVQDLFRSSLYLSQYGMELEYKNLGTVMMTNGLKFDNLEMELRWKKLFPAVDLAARFQYAANQYNWEAGFNYFARHYVFGVGYAHLVDHDYLRLHNEYNFNWHPLEMQGESDVLIDVMKPTDVSHYEYVLANEGSLQLKDALFLDSRIVVSNSELMNIPLIYRGDSQKQSANLQVNTELVYEQRFRYSLEILQLIQMIGIQYKGFFDYQLEDDARYALGVGISADVNLLGIKPSHIGGYLAFEPMQNTRRIGLDMDFTF